MLDKLPVCEQPITQLFGLANLPFEPHAFRHACEQFASFDASTFGDVWDFTLKGGASLTVVLETEKTGRKTPNGWPELRQIALETAILPLCIWETYDYREDHESLDTWEAERAEFDRYYAESLASAIEVLGPPRIRGEITDEYEFRRQYAMWRGKTGLLVLKQSYHEYYPEVCYWVQPWSGPDPQPTSPLDPLVF
jgi:hypothetical protein